MNAKLFISSLFVAILAFSVQLNGSDRAPVETVQIMQKPAQKKWTLEHWQKTYEGLTYISAICLAFSINSRSSVPRALFTTSLLFNISQQVSLHFFGRHIMGSITI